MQNYSCRANGDVVHTARVCKSENLHARELNSRHGRARNVGRVGFPRACCSSRVFVDKIGTKERNHDGYCRGGQPKNLSDRAFDGGYVSRGNLVW